jgi:hypothetical protein
MFGKVLDICFAPFSIWPELRSAPHQHQHPHNLVVEGEDFFSPHSLPLSLDMYVYVPIDCYRDIIHSHSHSHSLSNEVRVFVVFSKGDLMHQRFHLFLPYRIFIGGVLNC